MKQLECRFYSRQEIAEITGVSLNDSRHFAERVKERLSRWGYSYNYTPKGVSIIQIPNTAEARLAEILIRVFNLDVQIDIYGFSCFLYALSDLEGFDSMPWEERATVMRERYGVAVSDRTLRSWCSRLMKRNVIVKSKCGRCWKTEIFSAQKVRTPVSDDDLQMTSYFSRRAELLAKAEETVMDASEKTKSRNEMWRNTMQQLWQEFQCCYYRCGSFTLTAINAEDQNALWEIYELTQEIVASQPMRQTKEKIITKEDFYGEWFA